MQDPGLSLRPGESEARRRWRVLRKAVQTRAFMNQVMMDVDQKKADELVAARSVKTQAKSIDELKRTPQHMQASVQVGWGGPGTAENRYCLLVRTFEPLS